MSLSVKLRRMRKPPPAGWEIVESTLEEFEAKMREAETDPHEGKRKTEAIHHQRSRYIYDLFWKEEKISRELYQFCIDAKLVDANLMAKWKKQGYERLCCLRCVQTRDTNFGTICICRVPKSKLEADRVVECQACGCRRRMFRLVGTLNQQRYILAWDNCFVNTLLLFIDLPGINIEVNFVFFCQAVLLLLNTFLCFNLKMSYQSYGSGYQSAGYDNGDVDPEEIVDDPTLLGGRRGTIFVVDVSKHMFEQDAHGDYYIKKAMVQMRDYLNTIGLSGSMVERVCIVFINAPPDADGFSQGSVVFYPKQTLKDSLDNVTAELVQEVNEFIDAENIKEKFVEKYGKGESKADIAEILHNCERYFNEDKSLQKVVNIYSRNIPLEKSPELQARLANRIAILNKSLHIHVFLVDFPLNTQPDPYWDILDPDYKSRVEAPKPDTTFIDSLLRSNARIPFLLGDGVEIPVSVYSLVHVLVDHQTNEPTERTAFFAKKADEEENGDVHMPLSTHMNETKTGDITEAQRIKANQADLFKKVEIGEREIILNSKEFEALRRVEPTGIRLIGFKRMSTLKESHRMGKSYYLYPLEDMVNGCTKLYTAMYKTCIEKDVYALARITFRANMAPQMCALIPQSRIHPDIDEQPPYAAYCYEGFHAIALPFMQDKRNLQKLYEEEDRKLVSPNETVLEPVKRLVERLTTDYIPDKFVNPKIQGHYRMLECLALQYDADECKEQLQQCEIVPFYENEGLRDELADELEEIGNIIKGADPNDETLAKKRKQGTTSNGGAKRGKK
ncbi:hypothetical protein M3Y97_00507400 [Aphelenchoides bicaudatus]|nr:hypothetical protein M3Y97_00507400 [Aphelenchoides bicaudatus]